MSFSHWNFRIDIATRYGRWFPLDKSLRLSIPGWRNRRMQIQVNIDMTIVLIAIVQLIRVIIIIHEENKKR